MLSFSATLPRQPPPLPSGCVSGALELPAAWANEVVSSKTEGTDESHRKSAIELVQSTIAMFDSDWS